LRHPPYLPPFPTRRSSDLATNSLLSSSLRELAMPRDPVEPRSISARLDRSNDGQDHMVLPYASAPFVRTQKDLTRFISPWSRIRSEEHTSELQSRENLVCR